VSATLDEFIRLDDELARRGFAPMSEWWRGEVERFYTHPTARTWAARVGRGGAKSTQAVKFAIVETLFGRWRVPPGERHYFAFISLSRDEAAQRLRLIESMLRALGVRHSRAGDVIELIDLEVGFRVFSCTVAGTSGFRCIGYAADEVAKWRSQDSAANPAKEVIASANAMTVNHPGTRRCAFSSPLGRLDWHAKKVDAGDTDDVVVSQAPTWIANPSITEADTRAAEPDERLWRREYLAVPQAGALGAFDVEAIDRAFARDAAVRQGFGPVLVIDASSGKKDTWTWAVCGWHARADGGRALVFHNVQGIEGRFWEQLSGDQVVDRVAREAKTRGIRTVHGDQRESLMLSAAFRRHNLRFVEHPWSAPAKEAAVATVRAWLRDDVLVLPEHDRLREELLEFEERVSPSGGFTFGARGSGHDDFVSLLLTAAMADARGQLSGSPRLGYAPGLFSGARRDLGAASARDAVGFLSKEYRGRGGARDDAMNWFAPHDRPTRRERRQGR
jgi:hypothetical protein